MMMFPYGAVDFPQEIGTVTFMGLGYVIAMFNMHAKFAESVG